MKVDDIYDKIGEVNATLLKKARELNQHQIDELSEILDKLIGRYSKGYVFPDFSDNRPPKLYNTKEAAKILGVTTQSIYNYVSNGTLISRGFGGDHRFTLEDLYQKRDSMKRNGPFMHCITNTISIHSLSRKLAVFRNNEKYVIIHQNKFGSYLFNEKWDGWTYVPNYLVRKNFISENKAE